MVRIYEDMSAEMVTELMAFSATVDPRLMRETRITMARETKIAFNGMFALWLI